MPTPLRTAEAGGFEDLVVHPAPEPKPEYTRGRLRAEVHPWLDTSCVADLLGSLLGGPSLDAGAGDGQAGHRRQT